jgi:hypothetical protein
MPFAARSPLALAALAVAGLHHGNRGIDAAPPPPPSSSAAPCPYQTLTRDDGQRHVAEVCEAFCSGQCSFFNTSAGETGRPVNLTLYRMTPINVTDAANKDLGDAPGDIGFFLSRRTLRTECALDPTNQRCFLAHQNIYASFDVEVDGQYGPYLMCNPAARSWGSDTSEFLCAVDCLTPPQCGSYQLNGTSFHGDYQCYCPRTNRTVGRQPRSGDWTPNDAVTGASLPSQCGYNFEVQWPGGQCLGGRVLRRVHSTHGGPAVEELLCKACDAEPTCTAWTKFNASDGVTLDTSTSSTMAMLEEEEEEEEEEPAAAANLSSMSSRVAVDIVRPSAGPHCLSATRRGNSSAGADASSSALWYSIGAEFGGHWYSLPAAGECGPSHSTGSRLGENSCSWRVVARGKRVSAACLEGHLDNVVERWNRPCFSKLVPPAPSNSSGSSPGNASSEAYLECYLSALLGDPAAALGALPPASLVAAWQLAFASTDPAAGGCKAIE